MVQEYNSILNWIEFPDPMANPYYPFDVYNLPFDIGYKLWEIIGGAIAWIFRPLGFGNWQATVASITGLVAKENIVGTMGVLYPGGWPEIGAAFTTVTGFSFLAFNLLCAPCFAAIGAIRREMNSARWTWFAIGYQCGFAYGVSLMINQFGAVLRGEPNAIGLVCAGAILVLMVFLLVRPDRRNGGTKRC